MNTFNIHLPSALSIPVAFLLQEHSLKDLNSFQDEHSLSIMHWAVINNDIVKITELLQFDFNYELCTTTNILPEPIISYQKLVELSPHYSIPFCKKGYTPVHLNVYLHTLHNIISLDYNLKGHFKSNQIKENHLKILKYFIANNSNIFSIQDNSGYSLLDYCFLLENIELIELSLSLDTSLSSLNVVKTSTALKIIEIIQLKYDIMNNDNVAQKLINPFISKCLTIKNNYEILNCKIETKQNNNENKRGKI